MFMECPSSEWHSSRNPVRSYLTKWFFWTDPVWFISCSFKNVWQTKTITVLWYFTRNLDVLICSMCVFDYRWFGSYRSIVCSRLSRAARRWPSRSRTSSRWSAPLSGPPLPWFQRSNGAWAACESLQRMSTHERARITQSACQIYHLHSLIVIQQIEIADLILYRNKRTRKRKLQSGDAEW